MLSNTTYITIVEHDPAAVSQSHIVKVLNNAGLEASVRAYGSTSGVGVVARWPSPYVIANGTLLLSSLLAPLLPRLRWLALVAACAGAPPMLRRALASGLTLDINALMLIAVAGTAALGDFAEAGAIVFLFTAAEWPETLLTMVPQKVVLPETGEVVSGRDVRVGDVVAVRAGEIVPVDGVVALVLSTPVATFCAFLRAARMGVLIKGGDVLESLGEIRVAAFDKMYVCDKKIII